jgi:NAD(P)-dependent dehydrogenase (short-subunit alcohol dehydrogenase family)
MKREAPSVYRDLEDKVVLVTGGASGIGYAIAQAFSMIGSRVVIVGRDKEKLDSARKEIGRNIIPIQFDLSEMNRLPKLVEEIGKEVGDVDVLVNNAGINLKKDALDVSDEEFVKIVRTNQTAVFALTREIGRPMVARGAGNIIMISSMASQYGIPKVVAYTASKSAIEGMTRALAVEWSPHGVRVNCIAPGFIKTAMSSKALDSDSERKNKVLSRTPVGKLGEPADVANAALFLASSQSKYITGVILPVDGGNSIGF